jgi:hypothetical protein
VRYQWLSVDFEQSLVGTHAAAAAAGQNPCRPIAEVVQAEFLTNGIIRVSGYRELREHYIALLFYTLAGNARPGSVGRTYYHCC